MKSWTDQVAADHANGVRMARNALATALDVPFVGWEVLDWLDRFASELEADA